MTDKRTVRFVTEQVDKTEIEPEIVVVSQEAQVDETHEPILVESKYDKKDACCETIKVQTNKSTRLQVQANKATIDIELLYSQLRKITQWIVAGMIILLLLGVMVFTLFDAVERHQQWMDKKNKAEVDAQMLALLNKRGGVQPAHVPQQLSPQEQLELSIKNQIKKLSEQLKSLQPAQPAASQQAKAT